MKRLLFWVAVPLLLLGAAMLIADTGATALWIAVIAVGLAPLRALVQFLDPCI